MKKILTLCFVIFFSTVISRAQTVNNTALVGTVKDSSGAVVPQAQIAAVNRDTKVVYPATTNDQGYYDITGGIIPGTYDVTVTKSGFQKTKATGVIVVLNQSARTDFALKIGGAATEVTVSANTSAIQTDDSLLGETVAQQQIEDLPMNGRNALDLANIASNVSISTGSALTGNPPGKTASGSGTRGVNNSITLDGISTMNDLITTATLTPNADALTAVQTQNGNYTAQYGDYIGVHINEATKSGTNALHGTTYDYLQNDALNSRGFNHSPTVPAKNQLRYNLFGFVLDGPVVIPHLYDGHNRTFFMGSYEGLRTHGTTNSYAQSWTSAERGGDFSQLLDTATNGQSNSKILLWSPFDGHPYFNSSLTSQVIDDQPAANNTIVQNFLSYASAPNVTAPGTLLTANHYNSLPTSTTENSTLDRVDENIGQNVRLFGRIALQNVNGVSIAQDYVNNTYNPTNSRNGAFGYTHILTPNLVNDLRTGFNWVKTSELNYFYNNGPKDADSRLGLGAPFGIGQASGNPGLPDLTGTNAFSIGEDGTNWIQDDRTYQLYDQISWTKGNHTFMAGADFRRLNIGRAAVNDARGAFNISSSYTANPGNSAPTGCDPNHPCTYGYGDASFYTGVLASAVTPLYQVKEEITQWRDGFFLQDTWQTSKKLTMELGVRYELPKVATSANGYGRIMDPTYTYLEPTSSATTPTSYTPTPGFPFTAPNHKDIGPHVGFAYRVTDRIVIRGGGGVYYNANQLNAFTLTSSNYPFASSVEYDSPNAYAQSVVNPYVQFDAPTPGAGNAPPVAGTPGTYVAAYSVDYHLPSETMYQWNLDNGIELWRNAGLELQYTGSRSNHLNSNYYPNQPAPGVGDQTLSVNARRPNQNFGTIRVASNFTNASYNGLTTILRQRITHGISANVSYTWAHSLDESTDANSGGSVLWQGHPAFDWGNSSSDIRHRISLTFTWQLPSLNGRNLLVQEALGGWQLNGLLNFQTGTPFAVTLNSGSNLWSNTGKVSQSERPNWVHPGKMTCNKQTLLQAPYGTNISCVDPTAYGPPAEYTFGNLHRNDLHGPGSMSNNLSLFKNFKLYQRVNLQLRIEGFNALNHANVGNPGNTAFNISSSSFAPSSAVFGTVSETGAGRTLQLAGKLNF